MLRHRRVPHIGGLAVSLSFLLRFASRHVPRGMPTWRVVQQLVQPHTQERALRWVRQLFQSASIASCVLFKSTAATKC